MADTQQGSDTQQHRTSIHDLIARVNRFVVSTAVILVLLISVTEQSIREYRDSVHQQSRIIREARKDLPRLHSQLGMRAATARRLASSFALRAPRLDSMKIIDPDRGVDQRAWCIRTLDSLAARKAGAGMEAYSVMSITAAITAVQLYQATYGAIWNRRKTIDSATRKIERLRSEKRSVPTPFGSFELNPGVALFGLTAATAITYLAFVIAVARLRELVRSWKKGKRGDPLFPSVTGIPYWLYSLGPELLGRRPASLREKALTALALSVHLTWIASTVWLASESINRWNVLGVIRTDVPALARYLIWAFAGMTAAAGFWLHLSSWIGALPRRGTSGRNHRGMTLRRRGFLGLGSLGAVFLLVAFFCNRRIHGGARPRKPRLYARHLAYKGRREWVANDRTRVLHHAVACADHLPKDHRLVAVEKSTLGYTIHGGHEARILEALADGVDAGYYEPESIEARGTESALLQAVEWSPYSYHLYDRLIRLVRRHGDRDRIVKLLNREIGRIDMKLALLLPARELTHVMETSKLHLHRAWLYREKDRRRGAIFRKKMPELIDLHEASKLVMTDSSAMARLKANRFLVPLDMIEAELASITRPKSRREHLNDRRTFRAQGRIDLIKVERLKRARQELLVRLDQLTDHISVG